jgi:hypothetical protein
MAKEKDTDQFSDEEATRRTNDALRRALTSPPKPHKEMKIGKRKAKVGAKASGREDRRGQKGAVMNGVETMRGKK